MIRVKFEFSNTKIQFGRDLRIISRNILNVWLVINDLEFYIEFAILRRKISYLMEMQIA